MQVRMLASPLCISIGRRDRIFRFDFCHPGFIETRPQEVVRRIRCCCWKHHLSTILNAQIGWRPVSPLHSNSFQKVAHQSMHTCSRTPTAVNGIAIASHRRQRLNGRDPVVMVFLSRLTNWMSFCQQRCTLQHAL